MTHDLFGEGFADNTADNPAHLPSAQSADEQQAWDDLRDRLAVHLSQMAQVDDHLVIDLPGGEEDKRPYVQFAGMGDGLLRAELAGDAHLAPIYQLNAQWDEFLRLTGWQGNDSDEPNWWRVWQLDDADTAAATSLAALQNPFGVSHPALLTYRAWGPSSEHADDLGLRENESPDPGPMVLSPTSHDELASMVRCAVLVKFDAAPNVDGDGDVVLEHLGQTVWVRVVPDQPAVEIFARVVHGVHSRRATALELAILNRDHLWVKWNLRERDVWQHLVLPGLPFAWDHLDSLLDVFFTAMTVTRDDLALRTGGRVG